MRQVLLDLEAVTDIDVTDAEALDTHHGQLEAYSVTLAYSRPRGQVVDRLRALSLASGGTLYPSYQAAMR